MADIAPTIPLRTAEWRVGRARYGADWIGQLSEREHWLIEEYVVKGGKGSILPGHITWIGSGCQRWGELTAEVERARDRRDWRDAQHDWVWTWLEDRGFPIDESPIDKATFEVALARDFPHTAVTLPVNTAGAELRGDAAVSEPAAAPIIMDDIAAKTDTLVAPTPKKRGPRAVVTQKVYTAMLADISEKKTTRQALIDEGPTEALLAEYGYRCGAKSRNPIRDALRWLAESGD